MPAEPMPRRTTLILLWTAIALAAPALGACGGGSSSPSSAFEAKAGSVCRQTLQQFERIQTTPPKTASQAEKQAAALVDVSEKALADLRDLTPPASIKSAYDRYLAAREQALSYLKDGQTAAANRDANAYAKAKRQAATQQATRLQLARKAGLNECSRPAVTLGSGGK
jgi:hypothetical protein